VVRSKVNSTFTFTLIRFVFCNALLSFTLILSINTADTVRSHESQIHYYLIPPPKFRSPLTSSAITYDNIKKALKATISLGLLVMLNDIPFHDIEEKNM